MMKKLALMLIERVAIIVVVQMVMITNCIKTYKIFVDFVDGIFGKGGIIFVRKVIVGE